MYVTGMQLADSALETLNRLAPYQIARRETSVVPGSELASGTVTLHEFRVTPASLSVVVGATDRLFGWAEPLLPNDLAFLAGHRELLVVIASEDLATLDITDEEQRELIRAVPSLKLEYLSQT
jgi:hypothetical protein